MRHHLSGVCLCLCASQVFPHVLHVRQLGLRLADAAEDPQLEAPLQVLPLVSAGASALGCSGLTVPHCLSALPPAAGLCPSSG